MRRGSGEGREFLCRGEQGEPMGDADMASPRSQHQDAMSPRMAGARGPTLMRLEDDPLLTVVQHLPLGMRLAAARVCKRLQRIIRAWPPVSVDLACTPPPKAANVLRWVRDSVGERLRALNLHGYTDRDINITLSQLLVTCNRLEVISLAHCKHLKDESLAAIGRHLPNSLRELCLWDAGRGGGRAADDPEDNRESCLTGDALGDLLERCQRLEALDVRGQEAFDDALLRKAGRLPNLAKFSLAGTNTSVGALIGLLGDSSSTVVRCGAMGLKGSSGQHVFPSCPRLRELQVSYCRAPIDIDLSVLPSLRFLGVNGDTLHQIDWSQLKQSGVDQIWADAAVQPADFWQALEDHAGHLRHLSLTSHGYLVALPPPIPHFSVHRMLNLQQITLAPCSAAAFKGLSLLPALKVLHVSFLPRQGWNCLLQPAFSTGGSLPPGTEVLHQSTMGTVVNEHLAGQEFHIRTSNGEIICHRSTVTLPGCDDDMEASGLCAGAAAGSACGPASHLFPAVTELSLTECLVSCEMMGASFAAGAFPKLRRLHIARSVGSVGEPPDPTAPVVAHQILGPNRYPRLSQVQALLEPLSARPSGLDALSLPPVTVDIPNRRDALEALRSARVGLPEGPRVPAAELGRLLGRVCPDLTELHLATSVCDDLNSCVKVQAELPRLKILGPRLGHRLFDEGNHRVEWIKVPRPDVGQGAVRWLRRAEPHGYAEGSCVKPDCSFMRFMEFAIDPVYTTTRPDDGDAVWPVQRVEEGAGDAAAAAPGPFHFTGWISGDFDDDDDQDEDDADDDDDDMSD